MRTLAKITGRPNYLFSLLPGFFKENDSYKDGNNEGLLERYLEIFCKEVDEEVVPYIDSVGYLYDVSQLVSKLPHVDPLKFLDHIAELFDNPPNIGSESQYIILLRYIRQIYQTKGTTIAINLFLAIYGYTIHNITETSTAANIYDATPTTIKYDNGAVYDSGFTFYSGWDLVITDLPGKTPTDPGATWMTNELKVAIQKFISPIFSILNSVTYST